MIYIVHGEDTAKSRNLILNQQKKLTAKDRFELDILDSSPSDLFQKLNTKSLFGEAPFVVFNITKAGRTNVDKYVEICKGTPRDTVLIIYSEKILSTKNAFIKNLKSKEVISELKPQGNVFKFTDTLFYKNRNSTYKQLQLLLNEEKSPFEIFSGLLYALRTLAQAKFESESLKTLKPFVKSKAITQAKNFTKEDIVNLFQQFYEMDRNSKIGELDPDMLLTSAIEKVLNS